MNSFVWCIFGAILYDSGGLMLDGKHVALEVT